MKRGAFSGLSFLELMVSVFIMAVVFLYVIPIFLTGSHFSYQQSAALQASLFGQAEFEKFRQLSRIYTPPSAGADFFSNLQTLYDPTDPFDQAGRNQGHALFTNSPFDPNASYIVAYGEGADAVSASTVSKRIVIHLEWNVPSGANQVRETFTAEARVARPSDWFPTNPTIATFTTTTATTTTLPTTTSTTSTTATSTTSVSSTGTSTSTTGTSTSTTSTTANTSTSWPVF